MLDERRARGTSLPNYLVLSVVLLLVGVTITIVQYKIPSILEPVMAQYGMSPSVGSWLMSIFTAVGIFLSLPTGTLSKKIGPKRVVILGCFFAIAGSVVGAFAQESWVMVFSRGIEGVAFVFITVAAPLMIEKYVARENQGTANGIWSLWICLGSVVGSTATPMVFQSLGLTGTWLAYATLVAVMAAVLALFVRIPAESPISDAGSGEGKGVALADYMRLVKPNALLYFFAYFVFNVEILAVLSYTPTFLQGQGMNASLSGFASSLPGLLAVVSAVIFGKLIDRTGKTKVFYLVALVAAAPATYLMLTQSGPLLWVGAAVMGFIGYGIPVASLTSLPQIAGSKALVPATMGVFMLVQCLGEFVGSLVTPLLLGPEMTNWEFCGMMMLGLGLAGAVAIAFCKIK